MSLKTISTRRLVIYILVFISIIPLTLGIDLWKAYLDERRYSKILQSQTEISLSGDFFNDLRELVRPGISEDEVHELLRKFDTFSKRSKYCWDNQCSEKYPFKVGFLKTPYLYIEYKDGQVIYTDLGPVFLK